MMKAGLMAAALLLAPVMASAAEPVVPVVTASGTRLTDTVMGKGAEAFPGSVVTVHYTGWLYSAGMKGRMFDTSVGREPFSFILGAGEVILGWDEGVAGMRVGGKRTLLVPSLAGYGERGAGADIPPGATLIFDVELLKVE
jgi:FKBP-type peptidyl-prolyl cis-trans isomerase